MSIPVRQSTAFETSIGPILDADGVAVTDGVVGDFKIKKTTGNFAALNGSATLTHVSAGFYDLVLTTSDLDTVGLAVIAIDDTTNACAPLYLQVMEEAIYDALYAASANAFQGAAGSTKVTGVVLVDTLTTYTGNTPQTADHTANIAAILEDTGTTLDGKIDAIDNILDTEFPALVTEVGKIPKSDGTATWNATALASIQSESNDSLVAFFTSAAALVDNIWDEVIDTSAHNGADSAGQKLRLASEDKPKEGTVDPTGATTTSFRTDLTEDDDHWNDAKIIFIDGALDGQSRAILDYANTNGLITLDEPLTSIPVSGAKFVIESDHIHPVSQVATAVWASPDLDAAIQAAIGLASANLDTQLADLPTVAEFEARTLAAADYATDASQTNQDTEIADIQTTLAALFTTALTESYAADGATQTVAQLLYKIDAHLSEVAITGTSKRLNKLDGSTQAMTFALNSATTPTAITRDA